MDKTREKTKKKAVDFVLLISIAMLVFMGIIMVFSASWPVGMSRNNSPYYFLKRHILWVIIGLIGMFLAMNFDYRKLKKISPYVFLASLILGALVFTPLGESFKGGRRWLKLGSIVIMPSDTIKFGAILFFARFLSAKRKDIKTFFQGTLPAIIIIAFAVGIIIIEDLGTGGTLLLTMLAMFFVAGLNLVHAVPLGALGYALINWAINDPKNKYRLARMEAYKDPFADRLGSGWQLTQSLYSLGSGGVLGLGLGKSRQKFFYLSEAYNDFIFAIIGEELGFVGSAIILLIIFIVIWRGVTIALNIEDSFGCFLATGITALIAVQSLVHIGVVTSAIPTTGITLPFVSYGGTSLVMFMTLVGILLNISRYIGVERR